MSFARYLIAGHRDGPTRFHDAKGNFGGPDLIRDVPVSLAAYALIRLFGWRLSLPFLPWPAARAIAAILRPDFSVIEFGSGMSTPWLAKKVRHCTSIEHDPIWYDRVQKRLASGGLTNVDHQLRSESEFADLASFADASFDFAIVDGRRRRDCVLNVAPKIKPGGWLFLDDTDVDRKTHRGAEAAALSVIADRGGEAAYFTGMVASAFFSQQSLLAKLP